MPYLPFVLYLLALAVFAMGTSEFMLSGLLPDLAADLHVTVGTAGLLTTAFAVGMIVGAPTMAAVARAWPPRISLSGFVAVFLACHVLAAVSTSFALVIATRVVAALANAGFLAVALSVAGTLVAPDRKGRALAVLLAGTTVATIVGVPAGAALGAAFGWRSTFWAVAIVCVPALIGVSRIGPGRAGPRDHRELRAELAVARRTPVVVAIVLAAVANAATFATFTYLAPLVTDEAGLTQGWVPIVLVSFGLGSFVGVTVAGRVADRRPGLLLTTALPVLLAGWIVLAVLAAYPAAVVVLAFVQGALSFAVGSTLIARILYRAGDAPTMAGSYATAALNVGAAVGPVAAGYALRAGPVGPVWVSAALVAVTIMMTASDSGPSSMARVRSLRDRHRGRRDHRRRAGRRR